MTKAEKLPEIVPSAPPPAPRQGDHEPFLESPEHIQALESLEHIQAAIHGSSDLDQMMEDVLHAVLEVFRCDRAWLLHPCDPEASEWSVPMECTRPGYPGAHVQGVSIPRNAASDAVFGRALGSTRPVAYGPGAEAVPPWTVESFGVRAMLLLAIHPKVGQAWLFGIHQCSHARRWTDEEQGIFLAVGRRIADALSSLLILRDLRQSEDRLEAQLRQAQKMEAVGQLAGGVAHDFNNILTAIIGHGELALHALDRGDLSDGRLRSGLEEILRSGRRAAGLTRQLLVFSRRDVVQVEVFDLRRTLIDMEDMLQRLLTEETTLEIEASGGPLRIRANRGQFEQVIMNLVLNARDAMSGGGSLRIELRAVDLDDAHVAAHPESALGPHVLLAVHDSGCGMEAKDAERIFEPFFSTKPVGKGSGLGLSVVYGIVRQSGGHILLETAPGKGTTFRIYVPAADTAASRRLDPAAPASQTGGTETVLVCEDDVAVRELTTRMLEDVGYRILSAEHGEHALELAAAHDGTIQLLLTDLVMPGMDGKKLHEILAQRVPGLRTLFVSGHAYDLLAERELLDGEGPGLLPKPFSRDELLRRVRRALDEP